MKFNKFKFIAALAVFLTASFLSSCDTAEKTPVETSSHSPTATVEAPYSEHLELSFMPRKASSEKAALSQDDFTVKFLEERYNVSFNIIKTSSEDAPQEYGEILTTLIASGNIPDFMDIDVLGRNFSEYEKLLDAGIALDVSAFFQSSPAGYPMLEKHILEDPGIDKFMSEDEKLYCLPHYAAPNDTVYLVRGDWAQKAGYNLQDINTLEKFSELMNVFVEKDFDQKGTDGFSTGAEKYLYPIYAGYTGAYMFKKTDDGYVDWYTLYELRESLGYLYLMYETDAFDNDYLSHDGAVSKEKITTGRAGCVATEIANLPLLNAELQENIPEGYLAPLPISMKGPGGTTRFTDQKNATANIISIYFEDPARIFDMCEFLFTDQGEDLILNGIEGVHYTKAEGDIVPNYEVYDAEGWKYKTDGTIEGVQIYNEIRNIITNFDVIKEPEYSSSAAEWYDSLMNYPDILSNPFEDNGFNDSKAYAAMTAVKDKWIDDFISGDRSLSDKNWDKFVKEYLNAGAREQLDFYNSQDD